MLYFARHLEVVAGVAPEAAPLESFGVEEHHCVARLATAAVHRARSVVLAPDYSSPRRLSAACPPTGQGGGPAQDMLTWVALDTPRRATAAR